MPTNFNNNFPTPIYLDYQATTPLDKEVLEAMLPYFTIHHGNPHSNSHMYGEDAEQAVEKARAEVAKVMAADPKEIIFTSGATEACNLALKGVMEYNQKLGKNHLIVSQIEHKCVLVTAKYLATKGCEVTYLPVDSGGLINLEELEKAIKPNTALVSIMAVNNEVGVIQPIKQIGALCHRKGVLFHTDAAQAIGKITVNVESDNIDLLSLSGHKIYGPKGIGALYLRRKPRVRLVPQMHGGGQERGMRSGTLSPALCVGLGKACSIISQKMDNINSSIKELSNYFVNSLLARLPRIVINGSSEHRVPHTVNISFAGIEGESLLLALQNVAAISTASACSSASLEASYVLKAMHIDADLAHSSLRFGIGKYTTKEEIDFVIDKLCDSVQRLREMSPIWDMIEQGIDLKTVKWHEH